MIKIITDDYVYDIVDVNSKEEFMERESQLIEELCKTLPEQKRISFICLFEETNLWFGCPGAIADEMITLNEWVNRIFHSLSKSINA